MTKYLLYIQDMIKFNKEIFDQFKLLHDNFSKDPQKYQGEFNALGREVQDIIMDWENRLCGKSDGAGYSKYTLALSEKFQGEVKKMFPNIGLIGMKEIK